MGDDDEMVARFRIVPETNAEHALAILVEQLRVALREACDIADRIASADHHGVQHNDYERIAELRRLLP